MQKIARLLLLLMLAIGPSLQGLARSQSGGCCCSGRTLELAELATCCQSVILSRLSQPKEGCGCQRFQVTCQFTGCDCGCGLPNPNSFQATLPAKKDSCSDLEQNHSRGGSEILASGWELFGPKPVDPTASVDLRATNFLSRTPLQRCCLLSRWLL
jgi:hypothetical protein